MKKIKLKYERPIVFFDLETTGVDVVKDRIVSIAVIKLHPDGSQEEKMMLVNPTIPIPAEATEVHKITNEMVADKPTFKQIAVSLSKFFSGCDIAGYNNNSFDNVLLSEEFSRCDIAFPEEGVRSIDVCSIFKKYESRTLGAAMKFYCGEDLEGAHESLADTRATLIVFKAQLEKYEDLKGKDISEIAQFSGDSRVDVAGKIAKDKDGDYIYTFGTNRGKKVKDNIGMIDWMLRNDFSKNTKDILRKIQKEVKK